MRSAPTQRVQRDLSGLVIAPDDQQLLAWRRVPTGRIIVNAAVPHIHAIDDGITNWPAALDDPPTHTSECRSPISAVNLLPISTTVPPRAPTERWTFVQATHSNVSHEQRDRLEHRDGS